jgi:alpha-tubulin suppressor-like RCC1 family protein
MALKTDGTVVAWGENGFHQTDVPAGLSNVVAIAAGENFGLAITTNRAVAEKFRH